MIAPLEEYYTFEDISKKFKEMEKVDITLEDLVLLVLGLIDKPINGRVVFHKELFLTYKELEGIVKISRPEFIKYRYGPFSPLLAATIDLLENAGYIRVVNRRSTRASKFLLSSKGKRRALEIISFLERKLGREYVERLKKLRVGWDQLGHDGILKYVYSKYPEYLEKSAKKNKFITIDWGVLES